MTAASSRSDPSRSWWSVEALGEVFDATSLFAAWIRGLRACPGDWLVLEQGAPENRGAYLQVYARPELLGVAPGGASGVPVRLSPRATPRGSPGPGPTTMAYGRLVWPSPPSREGRGAASKVHAGALAPAGGPGSSLVEPGSAVQAVLVAGHGPSWAAHVRVAGLGDGRSARAARDRTGLRWAAVLGAGYEPWAPGSPAHGIAEEEWSGRSVVRFHSGPGDPPAVEALASVWRVPARSGAREAELVPPRGLLLGWSWEGGSPREVSFSSLLRHAAVVGMTGSGKTQLLAHLAAESSMRGLPFVLFDLHGDLGPSALSRLPTETHRRVVVVDATRPLHEGLLGVNVLGSGRDGAVPSDLELDRLTSEVLSALRPLGGGSEEFWGPRMERFLEAGIRAVLEAGGTLFDVAELLHDPRGHAYELSTKARSEPLRRFLTDLPALARRNPDLLSSSQNRLSKVLFSTTVRALVAPPSGGLDLEELLASERSLVVHLPKGSLGESSSLFVANLLLARVFMAVLRGHANPGREEPRRLLLLDEAQGFSPRLLRSLVEEGRKFGCACVFATQSPARLEEVFARSPTDAVGTLLAMRLPPTDAQRIAPALLPPGCTSRGAPLPGRDGAAALMVGSLASLPPHAAWVRFEGAPEAELLGLPRPVPPNDRAWSEAATASALELASPSVELLHLGEAGERATVRALLLRALEAEATGSPLDLEGRYDAPSLDRIDPALSPVALQLCLPVARQKGWIEEERGPGGSGRVRVTSTGWAMLGYQQDLGAPSESPEHRRLLFEAFRIFLRNHALLELPEQGHWEHKTPDGILRVAPADLRHPRSAPGERLELLQRATRTWVWRLGHGRDIHVEAEVSGADRPERLANDWAKARQAHAYLLVLVGTPERGRKVRRFLRQEEVGPDRATVWVLRPGRSVRVQVDTRARAPTGGTRACPRSAEGAAGPPRAW